jgi:hypothetical protein
MFCPACGTDIPHESKFCLKCGSPLDTLKTSTNQVTLAGTNISPPVAAAGVRQAAAVTTAPPGVPTPRRGFIVDRADLQRRYASMSDSELVALWPSDLTDVARGCVDEELSRRGSAPSVAERFQTDLASTVTLKASTDLISSYNQASNWLAGLGIVVVGVGVAQSSRLVVALGWIIWIVAVAYYAKAKGRSPAWSLLSLPLSPLVGAIAVALLGIRPHFTCLGCGHVQGKQTRSCWGCGKTIVELAVEPVAGQQTGGSFRCPQCKTPVQLNAKKCPECGCLLKVSASEVIDR